MALDRPFEPGEVMLPGDARIDGERLIWNLVGYPRKKPHASVLDRFRRLHAEPPERLLAFVRQFGVGYFCEQHDFPASHGQVPFGMQFGMEACSPCHWEEDSVSWFAEKIEVYRRFSLAADSIVHAAAMVNVGRLPGDETLRSLRYSRWPLIHESEKAKPPRVRVLLARARARIADEVNMWIALSGAYPTLKWRPKHKTWQQTLMHSPWGVLGAVALALFTTVPQSEGWLICDVCGEAYQPKRPAAADRNHYCPNCRGSAEMWRFLKQQQRSRR